MIIYKDSTTSIFDSTYEALVNPVNCVGTMGAGLAKEFKRHYPEMFNDYKDYCDNGILQLGDVVIWRNTIDSPDIILFPTKHHWREKTKTASITMGLLYMRARILKAGIHSIAIPAIGCGLGELSWDWVKPQIVETFQKWPLDVEIYEPRI